MAHPSSKPKPEELLLQQFNDFLAQKDVKPAKEDKKSASKKDVTKALKAFTKIRTNLESLYKEVEDAMNLLSPEESETVDATPKEVDPEAPYGRKKDGTPKSKPGAPKANAAATTDDTTNAEAANNTAEAPAVKPAKTSSKKNAQVAA